VLYAYNNQGNKILAQPHKKAICPSCNNKLISKCGEINIWHWSHKHNADCDTWSEGESKWHLNWKSFVKKRFCEVVIGNHRADIVHPTWIIELQKSHLSSIDICERQKFYKNMIWIVDGQKFSKNFHLVVKDLDKNIFKFKWKWARKSYYYFNNYLFIHLNHRKIFHIKKISRNCMYGWGKMYHISDFINIYMKPILKKDYKKYLTIFEDEGDSYE